MPRSQRSRWPECATGYSLLPGEPQGSSSTYTYNWDNLQDGKVPYGGVTQQKYHFAYDSQTNTKEIWVYDPPGSLNPSFSVCLAHDPFGRLVKVSRSTTPWYNCSTVLAQYKYDHRGRRIARWLASTNDWTYFLHDPGGSLLSELKKPAAVADPWSRQRDYVWLDGRPLAQVETPAPGSAFTYYYHVDHIGLPRALTNQSGQTVWSASAPPYGDVTETTTTDPLSGRTVVTNLRLPGQYDERLFAAAGIDMKGPYYNWNRWYLPGVGRYLEVDPIALGGGLNGHGTPDWYNYALGNPVRLTDRYGTVAGVDDVLFLAGAAALVAAWETYVVQCTAAGTCPWSPKKCEPVPLNPPMPEPFPVPMPPPPLDLAKKNCGCTCLKSSGERRYIGVMREDECRAACVVDSFNGYQCGGAPQWPYPPFH